MNFLLPASSLGLFRLGGLLVLGNLELFLLLFLFVYYLGNLEGLVCSALWVGAVRFTELWDIHHRESFSEN